MTAGVQAGMMSRNFLVKNSEAKKFFKMPFFRGLPFTFINQFTTNHHTIHQHQHCNISQWAEGEEN